MAAHLACVYQRQISGIDNLIDATMRCTSIPLKRKQLFLQSLEVFKVSLVEMQEEIERIARLRRLIAPSANVRSGHVGK